VRCISPWRTYPWRWRSRMHYLVDLEKSSMAVRFKLAMLMSGWMQLYWGMSLWSLTSLNLKRRQHLEKSLVVSFFGIRNTSCFQARRQGGHPLLRVLAIHHLQVHPSTMIGTTTRARVHLDLHLRVSHLRPLISPRGMESLLLCRVVLPLRRNVGQWKSRCCLLSRSSLATWLRRNSTRKC
jgi:hypothetical protein